MQKFQKDRLLLLQVLRDFVSEAMEASSINPFFEQDVSEFMTDVTDKKRSKRLKLIRRELDTWIDEIRMERQYQLREERKRKHGPNQ